MKNLAMLGVGILCSVTLASAQEYKVKLGNTKDKKVTIEMSSSEVKIEGHNSDEVVIQTTSAMEVVPERAKGLKPIYYNAVDNSGIGLAVTTEGGGLKIEKATRKAMKYTVKLPKKVALLYNQTNWQGGSDITISNMEGDLEIKTNNSGINLVNVMGPVVANSISGEIKVAFSGLSQEKPTAISTVSGVIDITMPAVTKSNLKLRSINGEMYTDFDLGIKNTKDGLSRVGTGNNIESAINGGGVEMVLHTVSSDIYIRKQK